MRVVELFDLAVVSTFMAIAYKNPSARAGQSATPAFVDASNQATWLTFIYNAQDVPCFQASSLSFTQQV